MSETPPRLQQARNATCLTWSGRPPVVLGGELRNSSAASPGDIKAKFAQVKELRLNTVLAPVSWELIEPVEGAFDFTLVETMIEAARSHGMRLVPLWFGTLKNAMSCYTPAWVKTDPQRFPRAQTVPGRGSWAVSPFCAEVRRADARAFAALMRHIRAADAGRGTVLMVQVENEPGILHASRDHSPAAERAFAEPVPAALTAYLENNAETLQPVLADLWRRGGRRPGATWAETFGRDADEIFMAWHIARLVEQVAAAGRAEYDLPMFANAWLSKGPGYQPGDYPSGGPLAWLMDVWRAAAPHLDMLCPDIYQDDFRRHCADYDRPGNPLFIPEANNDPAAACKALYAIGKHRAIGFAPFAIDDCQPDHPLGDVYGLLTEMMPCLAPALTEGRTTAFLQQEKEERWREELDGIGFCVRTNHPMGDGRMPGALLLIALGNREYVAVGYHLTVTFEPVEPDRRTGELVYLDEGTFTNGEWQALRRLNGDETAHGTGLLMGARLCCYRFAVHLYA